MIRPEAGPGGRTNNVGLRRLYGCKCNVVYAQPQSPTGLHSVSFPSLFLLRFMRSLKSYCNQLSIIFAFSDYLIQTKRFSIKF